MDQDQRSFQKQPPIFLNRKGANKAKPERYYRNVGLGIKTPREAIEGTYVDKKCPFTGNVSIRGRMLTGVVVSTKMQRTIVVRRDYLHYIKKYNRYEKRHKNLSAHMSPCFKDIVQGRPLSKTVRFNVLKRLRENPDTKGLKQFQ